jgi:GTP-binding protein
MFKGTVAIVGRPNVGKSTLFNRLTRSNQAITDDRPGITRDRLYGFINFPEDDHTQLLVIDTGGFETETVYYQPFTKNFVWEQTVLAIEESDLVILVFDAKAGIHPHDEQLFKYLKKNEKRTICVANKVDGLEHVPDVYEFYRLGAKEVMPVSAAHNRGISDLFDVLANELTEAKAKIKSKSSDGPKIALIGGPNAGKSSILNRLCGFQRSIVSEVAGTTRDIVDTTINYNGKSYTMLDTAGIRRRSKILDRIESLSAMFSLRAIEDADVILYTIDALKGLTDQDARLINMGLEKSKPVLILINKWDLIQNKTNDTVKKYEQNIRIKLGDSKYVPVLFISCLENQRVSRIMSLVETLHNSYQTRVPTSQVNEALQLIVKKHTPQVLKTLRRRIKFYFASQVSVAPPTFVIMTNYAHEIQNSYKRYLINQIRERMGFDLIPIRLIFRNKSEKSRFSSRGARPVADKAADEEDTFISSDFDGQADFDEEVFT